MRYYKGACVHQVDLQFSTVPPGKLTGPWDLGVSIVFGPCRRLRRGWVAYNIATKRMSYLKHTRHQFAYTARYTGWCIEDKTASVSISWMLQWGVVSPQWNCHIIASQSIINAHPGQSKYHRRYFSNSVAVPSVCVIGVATHAQYQPPNYCHPSYACLPATPACWSSVHFSKYKVTIIILHI